jgi:hypothetical protein
VTKGSGRRREPAMVGRVGNKEDVQEDLEGGGERGGGRVQNEEPGVRRRNDSFYLNVVIIMLSLFN